MIVNMSKAAKVTGQEAHYKAQAEDYLAQAESAGKDLYELLTPRERQVFQLAAEGKTCAEIGLRLHLSERTVERHRPSITNAFTPEEGGP